MSMPMKFRYSCDGCGKFVEGYSDLQFPNGWLSTPNEWDAHLPRAPFSLAIVACSPDCVSAAKEARVNVARAAVEKFSDRVREVRLGRTDEPPNQDTEEVCSAIEDLEYQAYRHMKNVLMEDLENRPPKVRYNEKGIIPVRPAVVPAPPPVPYRRENSIPEVPSNEECIEMLREKLKNQETT